jgi:DNA-binding LacI/PurR family transcriptional regulator/DNA-binding transcriptional regulator YhcF (GntR family)
MSPVNSTIEALKMRLKSGDWPAGTRLPSLGKMARLYGVCRTTMWRAVSILQSENLLYTKPRGSIIAGPRPTNHPDLAKSSYAWQRLKGQIGSDILSHTFSGEHLPGIGKLALRYGSSINTIRKALEELTAEGVVSHTGRQYLLQGPGTRKYARTIVLIVAKTREEHLFSTDLRAEQIAINLERESHLSNFSTRLETFDQLDANDLLRLSAIMKKSPGLAGCIINLWDSGSDTFRRRWFDLFLFLTSLDVPVMVLDQEGNQAFPPDLLRRNNFRVFRIASLRAGEMIGKALLQRGHQCVAYVSPVTPEQWAMRRYEGLKKCWDRYGGAQARIELYNRESASDVVGITLAALGLSIKSIEKLYGRRLSREELADLASRMHDKSWAQTASALPQSKGIDAVQLFARLMVAAENHLPDMRIYNLFFEALQTAASSEAMQQIRARFFESIIARSAATAWVVCDDLSAIDALTFLEHRHTKVPEEISIIGFDDMRPSLEYGLSTYNFNMPGMVQRSLQIITDEKAMQNCPVISEFDGYVVERRTTRR